MAYMAALFSWAAVRAQLQLSTRVSGSATNLVRIAEAVQFQRNPRYGKIRNIREALRFTGLLLSDWVLTSRSGDGIDRVMTRVAGVKWVRIVGNPTSICGHGSLSTN